MLQRYDYEHLLGSDLLKVENPLRYLGGEYGSDTAFPSEGDLKKTLLFAITFPDTYEIGMSNTALKLIYQMARKVPGVWCGRSFVPSSDMEEVLRQAQIPLCTLESGLALKDLDVLGITIGFELAASNILSLLDLGGLPVFNDDRDDTSPLVLAGGPACTNPRPFEKFIDALVIGEAEACLGDLLEELKDLKIKGWSRRKAVEICEKSPHIWTGDTGKKVRRAVWSGFAEERRSSDFPIPSLRVIQDYGSLEIMRGCPQGCRFCHAGIFYRPYRQKSPQQIHDEALQLIQQCGYREISLASLSSGDYPEIQALYESLNTRFGASGVSFSLPSLKVNSFTLPLLAQMSLVKKSGLTFAVETPSEAGQLRLNKTVGIEATLNIMKEAKALGWKSAKLYFMAGLPGSDLASEGDEIFELLKRIRKEVGINLNVSLGTFVPKPHTPFQWAGQLDPEAAFQAFFALKGRLRTLGINLSYQSPFSSFLEGFIARGDENTARVIYEAWKRGARFDAWDEKLNKQAWTEAFEICQVSAKDQVCTAKNPQDPLAWDSISLGLGPKHLLKEYEKSCKPELSPRCASTCPEPCGICSKDHTVEDRSAENKTAFKTLDFSPKNSWEAPVLASAKGDEQEVSAMVFHYEKLAKAAYLPQLALQTVFERSLLRSGIPYRLSPGFSPHPILELGQALSLGVSSIQETGLIQLGRSMQAEEFTEKLNRGLPPGLKIRDALSIHAIKEGRKCPSLGKLLAKSSYILEARTSRAQSFASEIQHFGRLVGSYEELTTFCKDHSIPLVPQERLLEIFNAPSQNPWFIISCDSQKPSLRSLLEPLAGKDWQSQGFKALRLNMQTEEGSIYEAYESWRIF